VGEEKHQDSCTGSHISYDDSNLNEMRFEWILMEFMPGTQAYQLWRQLTMVQKTALTEQLADFQSQLLSASSKNNLRGIGNAVPRCATSHSREDRRPPLLLG
jgi:hypothetical protein